MNVNHFLPTRGVVKGASQVLLPHKKCLGAALEFFLILKAPPPPQCNSRRLIETNLLRCLLMSRPLVFKVWGHEKLDAAILEYGTGHL